MMVTIPVLLRAAGPPGARPAVIIIQLIILTGVLYDNRHENYMILRALGGLGRRSRRGAGGPALPRSHRVWAAEKPTTTNTTNNTAYMTI